MPAVFWTSVGGQLFHAGLHPRLTTKPGEKVSSPRDGIIMHDARESRASMRLLATSGVLEKKDVFAEFNSVSLSACTSSL